MKPLIAFLAPFICCAQSFTINTVVGSVDGLSLGGFSGDGGPATSALLYGPAAIAIDGLGSLYISDTGNHRIRKVSAGIISTFAGNGSSTTSGDGGPASAAGLSGPGGLAFDSRGNLYICDGAVVRRADSMGTISPFAGNGSAGASGDGGPATSAQIVASGIAIDASDNVYISDSQDGVVRRVSSGIISTIAGQAGKRGYSGDGGPATSAALTNPLALAFDMAGNLLIGDDSFVRKVDVHGIITTFAGGGNYDSSGDGGPAINAGLQSVYGLAVDESGNVFITDAPSNRIRVVSSTGMINSAAGNGVYIFQGDGGVATNAGLQTPLGLAASGSNIYASDSGHNLVRLLTPGVPMSGPAPVISSGGVVTLFSSTSTITPFSWVSIYGTNLIGGSAPVTWNGDYPQALGMTTVTVNGKPAFLSYASPTQVNILSPDDGSRGTVKVTLTNPNGTATSSATLGSYNPSFSLLGDGKHAAAIILRSDGSGAYGGGTYDIIGPAGTSLGYKTVPAKASDTVAFYGVGFGPTAMIESIPFSGPSKAFLTPSITTNGQAVTPSYAGMVSPGLFQFNVTLPSGLGTGDVLLSATVSGVSSPKNVVTTLQ